MSLRHSHYQTENYVTVTVFDKSICQENASIQIEESKVTVTISKDGTEKGVLCLHLFQAIKPDESTYKIVKNLKVDLKLIKLVPGMWPSLERTEEKKAATPFNRPEVKNWDKVVKESGIDEKTEGNEALNKVFQQIYKDSDPDTQKAMNKSFTESGGTVLSTDWSTVKGQKVEVKPPDGMEFKKYDV